ncbi:hypothetical protein DL93DRAFT_491682 [Clavulina sp. PMI_390]|nr:hypothetical protein DL93DRAFT_491682 [Clavulina sp. PMI_390]
MGLALTLTYLLVYFLVVSQTGMFHGETIAINSSIANLLIHSYPTLGLPRDVCRIASAPIILPSHLLPPPSRGYFSLLQASRQSPHTIPSGPL